MVMENALTLHVQIAEAAVLKHYGDGKRERQEMQRRDVAWFLNTMVMENPPSVNASRGASVGSVDERASAGCVTGAPESPETRNPPESLKAPRCRL